MYASISQSKGPKILQRRSCIHIQQGLSDNYGLKECDTYIKFVKHHNITRIREAQVIIITTPLTPEVQVIILATPPPSLG